MQVNLGNPIVITIGWRGGFCRFRGGAGSVFRCGTTYYGKHGKSEQRFLHIKLKKG